MESLQELKQKIDELENQEDTSEYEKLSELRDEVQFQIDQNRFEEVGETVTAEYGYDEEEIKGEIVKVKTRQHPDQKPLFILETEEEQYAVDKDEIKEVHN